MPVTATADTAAALPVAQRPTSRRCAARTREIAEVILAEQARQSDSLQLIAAENFTSPAVLAALGSPLANKYAEGYPGARHHGGCELVDAAERHRRRAGHRALRRRARQRAAPLRLLRRPRGVRGAAQARGHRARHGTPVRRPPHPRLARELLRPLVRLRRLRRRRRDRPHRLRPGPRPRPAPPSQGDRLRLDLVPPPPRLRGLPRDRRRGRARI